MEKRKSSHVPLKPFPRSGQMHDFHLVYADPEMGDPCALMLGGSAGWEALDGSHPDLCLEQEYLDRVVAARALGCDVDARSLIVGRVDLADGARRYIGCEDIDDADRTSLVVSWLSDKAAAFYRPDQPGPEQVTRKRVFHIEGDRILQILDEHYDDTAASSSATRPLSPTGRSRRRRTRSRLRS